MDTISKIDNYLNEEKSVTNDIMDFFVKNPYPNDDLVHGLAEKLGMDPDDFEAEIYSILSSFLSFGKFNESKKKEESFDTEELKEGIKIEMEHTENPVISKRIALDHLTEIPDYYTRLIKMEKEAEGE